MKPTCIALWLILASISAGAESRICPPPAVSSYSCSTCARLGAWIAEGFASPYEAATKLLSLSPDQLASAQLVTLSRSQTHVVVWRSTAEEREARRGHLHEIVVSEFHKSLPNPLAGAMTNYALDYSGGWDVAVVSTNDPETPVLMIERVLTDCSADPWRQAGRR